MVLPLAREGIARTSSSSRTRVVPLSLFVACAALNLVLLIIIIFWRSSRSYGLSLVQQQSSPVSFAGGHPLHTQSGTCYCSNTDHYCMCNPSLAIDLILLSGRDHVWVVRRRDTDQLACMGGFVEVGETTEQAVRRELREEMGLVLNDNDDDTSTSTNIQLVGVYSDPRRDNRRHTVSAVYAVRLDSTERPVAADDAKAVEKLAVADIDGSEFFADHKTILKDYFRLVAQNSEAKDFVSSEGDIAPDLARSVCLPIGGGQ